MKTTTTSHYVPVPRGTDKGKRVNVPTLDLSSRYNDTHGAFACFDARKVAVSRSEAFHAARRAKRATRFSEVQS